MLQEAMKCRGGLTVEEGAMMMTTELTNDPLGVVGKRVTATAMAMVMERATVMATMTVMGILTAAAAVMTIATVMAKATATAMASTTATTMAAGFARAKAIAMVTATAMVTAAAKPSTLLVGGGEVMTTLIMQWQ
jgi:hypothetical protein